jgi:hypothetical protein
MRTLRAHPRRRAVPPPPIIPDKRGLTQVEMALRELRAAAALMRSARAGAPITRRASLLEAVRMARTGASYAEIAAASLAPDESMAG